MIAALDQLLQSCIDYAGLFPPADLSLAEAIDIFAADRNSKHQNWLQHFILPATRIEEFDAFRNNKGGDSSWTLSILVGGGDTLHDWQTNVEDALETFKTRRDDADPVRVLEITLPRAIAADDSSFKQAIDTINQQLDPTPLVDCKLFFETTSTEHRRVLAEVLAEPKHHPGKIGLKLRTGGISRALFPSSGELAECIRLCHSFDIPWKATAGLHHPFPVDCQRTGAAMHGFMNILFAVILLEGNMIPGEKLEDLLEDRNPTHFSFCETGITWMDITANLEQICIGRQRFISFGSCSFAEPLEDLAASGLLAT